MEFIKNKLINESDFFELSKNQVEQLKEIVGKDNLHTDFAHNFANSRDYWPFFETQFAKGNSLTLSFAVCTPENEKQVQGLIVFANENKIPITPYGFGSGVLGNALPLKGGIIIDMKKFDKILHLDENSLIADVQPGINGMRLEKELEKKGYSTRHHPQSLPCSSLGGWIACKAAGHFSTKYGKFEDMLLSVRFVDPQGRIVETAKIARNATGPSIMHLILGSEGTLGIITQASIKIFPLPEKQVKLAYAFDTIDNALDCVKNIIQRGYYPAVIRIYDDSETGRHFDFIEETEGKVVTVFVCEGDSELAALEAKITKEESLKAGGIDLGEEPVDHWFKTRFNVSLSAPFMKQGAIVDTLEVSCLWKDAKQIYHAITQKMLEIEGTVAATGHFSHFYREGAGLYITFLGFPDKDDWVYYRNAWNAAMEVIMEYKGSIAHHHGIGYQRKEWNTIERATELPLLKAIKKTWDPNGIMNPGKLMEDF